jgi:hypothetical protein
VADPGDHDLLELFVEHVQHAVVTAACRPLSLKIFAQWLFDAW